MTKSIKVYGGELHVPLKVDDQMKRFIKEHERMAAIYKAAKLNGWI